MEVGERIKSNVSGREYLVTFVFDKVSQAEVGFASTIHEGESFFIKRLLNMRYPLRESPGSEAFKNEKRKEFDAYFDGHSKMYKTIYERCGIDGACVPIEDYFREGAFYYTVYRKIDSTSLTLEDISSMQMTEKLKLLRSLVQGLMPIHAASIVHGDLKPDNILVRKKDDDSWGIRLIDMNDCYISGNPPKAGLVVGTIDYYSPELAKYNLFEEDEEDEEDEEKNKEFASLLTLKSDVFALGIIFSEFLTGDRPYISDDSINGIWEAVSVGKIRLSDKLPHNISKLINEMLSLQPNSRPSLVQIHEELKRIEREVKPIISIERVSKEEGKVTIEMFEKGYAIFYTLDGTEPSKSSFLYSKPFTINKSTTIIAIAISNSTSKKSMVSRSSFVIALGPKIRSLAPKLIIKNNTCTISSLPGVNIYYTTNGKIPTNESQLYTDCFMFDITVVTEIKAISIENGKNKIPSEVVCKKVFKPKAEKPVLHYSQGKISIESEVGEIYYTIDGSEPTRKSKRYIEPFYVEDFNNFIVKAFVFSESKMDSDIAVIKRPSGVMIKK